MKKIFKVLSAVLILLSLISIVVWQLFYEQKTSLYIVAVIILILSAVPFLFKFEKNAVSSKEMALVAVLVALAVVSRAVFYLIPQFKPIGAVVIVSAVCLGAQRGYIIGAFGAFISNFIFGQGVWTPFQMVALGLVGFISGLIFKKIKPNKFNLSVIGFLLTSIFYSLIVDFSSVLTMSTDFSLPSVAAIYLAGAPFSIAFGSATAIFLFLFGEAFIKKLSRIIIKYGIVDNS